MYFPSPFCSRGSPRTILCASLTPSLMGPAYPFTAPSGPVHASGKLRCPKRRASWLVRVVCVVGHLGRASCPSAPAVRPPFEEPALLPLALPWLSACEPHLAPPTIHAETTSPLDLLPQVCGACVHRCALGSPSRLITLGTPHGRLHGADGRRAVATWLGKHRWLMVFRSMKVRACDSRRTSVARV